ncbi:hypothetical protein PIB30_090061 [Stylosanthes scabra]|uniref:Uncharacterized protein n=1 Tax=Stylosanthes scabra TaxID=79078 RepID=A0ABU6SUJ2_9FABA|nr:hypothetical protein [Stylosanthes scabra]
MAHAGTPSSTYMPDPYVVVSDPAPAPAPQDPDAAERGVDEGGALMGTNYYSLDTITSCGASLVAILPGMADLSAKTTSSGPIRIHLIHVRPDSHGPRPSCPCSPHAGSGIIVGSLYGGQKPSGMGGDNLRQYTLNTFVIQYTSWTYDAQLTRECAQQATMCIHG